MNKNKILLTMGVVGLAVSAVLVFRLLSPDPAELLRQRNAARSAGNEKAPLWITEYFDYQCPPCALGRALLEKAQEEFPGQIYLQVRFYPLDSHKNGMPAAVFAECASRQGADKFWKFHGMMFDHQRDWALDEYASFKFTSYAKDAGLDLGRLDACVHDPKTEETVLEEKKKAKEIGVVSTPTFFVNGKMVLGLTALMDELTSFFEKGKTPEAEKKP